MALGNVLLPRIQQAVGWSNRTVMVVSTSFAATVPLWAALGLVFPFAGLHTKRDINLIIVVAFVGPPSFDRADGRVTAHSSVTLEQSTQR